MEEGIAEKYVNVAARFGKCLNYWILDTNSHVREKKGIVTAIEALLGERIEVQNEDGLQIPIELLGDDAWIINKDGLQYLNWCCYEMNESNAKT